MPEVQASRTEVKLKKLKSPSTHIFGILDVFNLFSTAVNCGRTVIHDTSRQRSMTKCEGVVALIIVAGYKVVSQYAP